MRVSVRLVVLATLVHFLNAVPAVPAGDFKETGLSSIKEMLSRFIADDDLKATPYLSDEQLDINKRELEKRGKASCKIQYCDHLKEIPTCDKAMIPHFKDVVLVDDTVCTCLKAYTCCPSICPSLNETRKECDNTAGFQKQEVFEDCCTCTRFHCIACPEFKKRDDCPLCTVEQTRWPTNDHECPESSCVRLPPTPQTPPTCNEDCQRLATITNECGYHHKECKCLEPPFCNPEEPEKIECHTWTKVQDKYMFKCKSDNQTCEPCHTWKAVADDITKEKNQCDLRCENKKVDMLTCGSYKQTCECKNPENCMPEKPAEIKCHDLIKVSSETTFKCKTLSSNNNDEDKCEPCYHYEYQAKVKTTAEPPQCNSKCQIEVMNNTGCGIHEVKCICNGRDKTICQPSEPSNANSCYTAQKEFIKDSYMCGTEENTCEMCWQWTWKAPNCTERHEVSVVKCDNKCKNNVLKLDECGCQYFECDPHPPLADCWPGKPQLSECFTPPEKVTREVYSVENGVCVPCYKYKWEKKPTEDVLCENTQKLPATCFVKWNEKGSCGETIEQCTIKDEECVKSFVQCPVGLQKVTGFSACKQSRDVCIDCTELQLPQPLDDEASCFETYSENILGCAVNRYRKKACQISQLSLAKCPDGRERKMYVDDCDCPETRCTACSKRQSLDVQLIVDASGSVTNTNFGKVRNALAKDFLPNLLVDGSKSRVALTLYGSSVNQIRSLANPLTVANMLQVTYGPSNTGMGTTHTAEALSESFKKFEDEARWNDVSVKKVLVVITDGAANGPGDVAAAAKLWADKGVLTFALGVGIGIKEEGLQQISSTYVKNIRNFNKLKTEILDHLVVEICGSRPLI